MKNTNHKPLIITVSVSAIAFISATVIFVLFILGNHAAHTDMPDSSSWILENNNFEVTAVDCDDETDSLLSFYVTDKSTGNIVYECPDKWRKIDFRSININDSDIITVDSSDTGACTYVFSNGTFVLSDVE